MCASPSASKERLAPDAPVEAHEGIARRDGADDVEAALSILSGPVVEYDREAEPEGVKQREASTMGWGARQAWKAADGTPVAVIDRGEVGKEAIVKLLAPDADSLADRVFAVLDAAES